MKRARAVGTAILILLGIAAGTSAHEGHEHTPAPTPSRIAPRGEAQSDAFELVAVAEGTALAIYLDRFATNEPIGRATIEVEAPGGPVTASIAPGDVFRIAAPWLSKAGKYDLIFTVTVDDDVDVLPVTLEVPAPTPPPGESATGAGRQILLLLGAGAAGFVLALVLTAIPRRRARAAAVVVLAAALVLSSKAFAHEGEEHPTVPAQGSGPDLAQRLPDGSLFVPKATQRILAIRTAHDGRGAFCAHHRAAGPDHSRPECERPGAGLGRRPAVAAARRLSQARHPRRRRRRARLRHAAVAGDRRVRHAAAAGRDSISRSSIVERRVARYEPLAQSGAVSRVQLDEARLELQGLKDRRAALDKVRREPEALIAPVAGVIADGTAVAGQMAQPNTVVFHIVDPARLWIEALSFDALAGAKNATARTGTGQSLTLSYQGSGFADRNQSIPVHFAIEGDRRLVAGRTVRDGVRQHRRGAAGPCGAARAAWCAVPTVRTCRLRARQRRNGFSRARCGSSRSTASAC